MLIKRNTFDDFSDRTLEGTASSLDFIEDGVNKLDEVPIVGVVSKRSRKRVTSFTNPIKRLLRLRKKKNNKKS